MADWASRWHALSSECRRSVGGEEPICLMRRTPLLFTVVLGFSLPGCLALTSLDGLTGESESNAADGSNGRVAGDSASDGAAMDEATAPDGDAPPSNALFGSPETIATDASGVHGIAVDASNVYWTNPSAGTISRAPKVNGDGGALVQTSTPQPPMEIGILGGTLYVGATTTMDGLYSYATDLSSPTLVIGCTGIMRAVVAASSVFVSSHGCSNGNNRLLVLKNGVVSTLYTLGSAPAPTTLTFDGESVYYYSTASETVGTIQRIAADGTASEFAKSDEPADLLADTNTLYVLTNGGKLVAYSLPTGPSTDLATGLAGAQRLAMDASALYVAAAGLTAGSGRIVRVPRGSGETTELATAQAAPHGIAVDNSGVYWVNNEDGTVKRVARH